MSDMPWGVDVKIWHGPAPYVAPASPAMAAKSDALLAMLTASLTDVTVLDAPMGFAPAGTVFRSLPR